jgi:CelD/BcsL family acetyltransferase involved in cellulose biosynthesis
MSSLELAEGARRAASLSPRAVAKARPLAVEITDDLKAIEELWRAFESEAVCSPYQRFDWVRSFAGAFSGRDGFDVRVVIVRQDTGRPLLVMPLALNRRHGLTIASLVGGKQANFHLPLFARGMADQIASEMPAILKGVARSAQIDAFMFENVPLVWGDERNPLVLGVTNPGPNDAYELELTDGPESVLKRIGSSESRRKLRKKEKALAQCGTLNWRLARTTDDIEAVLDCFFHQKSERFRALGIRNLFQDELLREFIHRACFNGLDAGLPAVELYGLWLDNRIVATFGGAVDRQRLSCMINSFDGAPDVARYSPGYILLSKVIRAQHELGRTVIDLGVGEARYKTEVCDRTAELRDVFVPITPKGRVYVALSTRLSAVKRFVKQTPWAWELVRLARAARARLTSRPSVEENPGKH